MIKLHSSFPSDWKHVPEHGSSLRAEVYEDKVVMVIYDASNETLGKAMLDRDKAAMLKDFLDEYLNGVPNACRTGIFD